MIALPLVLLPLVSAYSGEITTFADNFYTVGHLACMDAGYVPQDPNLFSAMSVYFLSDQTSIINSGQCGKCIRLTGDKGSVVVTVMDVMLNPDKSMYDVDLSLPAFQAVTFSDGLGRANWTFVNCSTGLPAATATVPIPVPNALPTANGTVNSNGTGIPAASAITTTKSSFATSVAITSAMMALAALSMI